MPDLGLKSLAKSVRKGAREAKVLRPEEAVVRPPVAPAVQSPAVQSVLDDVPLPEMGVAGELDAQAARLSEAKLQDFDLEASHQMNFDKSASSDDVKATIAELAQQNKVRVDAARRNVIPDESMRKLAESLGAPEQVVAKAMQREAGGAFSPELTMATGQWVDASATRIRELAAKIRAGKATDVERVAFVRQQQLHVATYDQFMGARAEWGRTGRVLNSPLNASPAQLASMREMIDRNGYDIDKLASVLADVDTTAGVTKLVRKYQQSKVEGVVTELFVNSILSGPKTFLVNLMGNALFQAMQIPERAVAAGIGKVNKAVAGALKRSNIGVAMRAGKFLSADDHVLAGEASALMHGTISAVRDGFRLAYKAMKSGRTLDDSVKFERAHPKATSSQNLMSPEKRDTPLAKFVDGLGAVIRAPTERAMAPTDEFFKTLAYRAEIERRAFVHAYEQVQSGAAKAADAGDIARDFMENAPIKAQEAAAEYSRYVTFQNDLGPVGKKAQSLLRSIPGASLIAPFIRTPVNIFKAGVLDRSPLALFTKKFYNDLKAGGRQRDMALARVSMGSLTAAWVASEVVDGNITGGGPQNEAARQLLQAQGWRPYSIRWTNPATGAVNYTSYARLEPLAFVVGATADTVEILSYVNSDVESMKDEEAKVWEATAAIIAGIANNTMSKTFTKGIADFSEVLSDPARYTKQWAGNFATAFIPYSALRRQIGQIQDPYMREAWTILDKVKTQSGIPGFSEDAPPRRDIYGEPREYAAGDLVGPMSPIPSSEEVFSPITSEIITLMEQTNIVPVTMPDKRVEGMRLTADEYDRLVMISRTEPIFGGGTRTFKEELDYVMSTGTYGDATPVFRAELLKDVQHRADDFARAKLEQDNLGFADRIGAYRAKKERLRFDR